MLDSLHQLPAVRDRKLSVAHSLGNVGKKTLADIRYVLTSFHDHHDTGNDPMGIAEIPDEILAQLGLDESLLREYLESERDKGIDPLSRSILDKVPGGLLINGQINRGLLNLNLNEGQEGVTPAIWTPEAFEVVNAPLREIHGEQLLAYRKIVAALGKIPILHLHSMDISGPKKGLRPKLSRESLPEYVAAQGWGLDRRNPRQHDFITGKENGVRLADMDLYTILGRLFDANGMPWAFNDPYDTEHGYPDYRDMRGKPGRVIAPDFRKDSLCSAVGSTFDSRTAKVDPVRVEFMATLVARAVEEKLAA